MVGIDIAKSAPHMGPEFSEWLLSMTDEVGWKKSEVYGCLIQMNNEGKTALSHFADSNIWNKVAAVLEVVIAQSASAMGPAFSDWLLVKAGQEGWDKNVVHRCLMKQNKDGKSSYDRLNLVDSSSWNKVAAVVGVKIAELAPTMGAQFADWLLAKTEQEDWEKKSVYEHLVKPNGEGKIALAHFKDSSV